MIDDIICKILRPQIYILVQAFVKNSFGKRDDIQLVAVYE